ncbi:phosphoribosylformylglycinamidine synthase [Anaplasmataceae bacterium AB001_6]|nr:phosphoribosylformylglycinamidine synthase [Anaplasmataceae bacterium AB001_6]
MLSSELCDFRIEIVPKDSADIKFQFLTVNMGYISDKIVNTIEVFIIKGNIELSVIRNFFNDIVSSNQIWRGFAKDVDGKIYEFNSKKITPLEDLKWNYQVNNNLEEDNDSLFVIEAFEREISLDSPSTIIDRCMYKLLEIDAKSNYAFIILMNKKDYDKSDLKEDLNNLIFHKCHIRDKDISFYEDYIIDHHDIKNFEPEVNRFDFINRSISELSGLSTDNCWSLNNLQLSVMKNYYAVIGRNPTDVEVEFFAQSWSEHCKHTIFNSPIDDISDGLYKTYIRAATDQIIKNRGDEFCFSVFSDNAGAISLNDDYAIAIKVETHNSPCAIDPIGGAETGLLGVNRDVIGFGLGAKPIANIFCFCFAELSNNKILYVDADLTKKRLSTDHIYEGVIKGIELAGNKSGIPTVYGSMHFGEHFNAKPLVFAGTIGLIPKYINERLSSEKVVNDGDLIVIVGNRTGRDGIHGATSSSISDKDDIVSSTVQRGDPFTQKKVSDAIIKDARDRDLYNAITDNGAGGLSSSVGEMGFAGFVVNLDKVLLKYNDLHPWEIWISESQERMTLAVSPEKVDELSKLMAMHQVEMCVIGEFNYSGRGMIKYHGDIVADVDLDMLCNKMPYYDLKTKPYVFTKDPLDNLVSKKNLTDKIKDNNLCSREFLFRRYDHTVQANILLYPIHGNNAIDSQTSIIKPLYDSLEGVAVTHTMSVIEDNCDPFTVTTLTIEESIRKAIVVGSNPQKIALLDNFCWSNPYSTTRLFQLKESVRACYEISIGMNTPFVSGKDSMHNDFVGYNENANIVKVANTPTILITAIGVIEDCNQAVSFDAKLAGDLIYQIGFKSDIKIDFLRISDIYNKYYKAVKEGIIASAIAVEKSGLDYAIAKKLIANNKGAEITIGNEIWSQYFEAHIVITVNPIFEQRLLEIFGPFDIIKIGDVNDSGIINGIKGEQHLVSNLIAEYKNNPNIR